MNYMELMSAKIDIIKAVYQHYDILPITLIPSVSPTHFRHVGILAESFY